MSTSSNSSVRVFVEGIGLNGPGLANWPAGRAVLSGLAPYVSAPTAVVAPIGLAPAERRRVGTLVKLALSVGFEAVEASGQSAEALSTVFASSSGDGDNCHALCEALATDRLISPTRFTNSVHNAPSGYWGIVSRAVAPSTTLCAYDASFGAGLLEAVTQVKVDRRSVLLVAYDAPYPSPLREARPVTDALGLALVLSPERSERSLAAIDVSLCDDASHTLPWPELERWRQEIPAGRGLALLRALSAGPVAAHTRVVLDYLNQRQLAVEVWPCV
ncbi:MAG: beta-ketoacyl synthase chain length factor [Burkholderiales bacterium]|nr:beta-ketoacyl synthase chain length factor [Burkholderiales bacterium]